PPLRGSSGLPRRMYPTIKHSPPDSNQPAHSATGDRPPSSPVARSAHSRAPLHDRAVPFVDKLPSAPANPCVATTPSARHNRYTPEPPKSIALSSFSLLHFQSNKNFKKIAIYPST